MAEQLLELSRPGSMDFVMLSSSRVNEPLGLNASLVGTEIFTTKEKR
jgi:hypothetical protein